MRFYFVFFKYLPIWAEEMESIPSISTAFLDNKRRLHLAYPSGAFVHARAVIDAFCLLVNLEGAPGRGES